MALIKDLTGKRVGKLVVLWPAGYVGPRRRIWWLTQCDCGVFKPIGGESLLGSHVKSCGCLRSKGLGKKNKYRFAEYNAFQNAKSRCTNSKDPRYSSYGARGIKFLFETFRDFSVAIGPRPKGMTLDRIDNDGNYEAGNVRWATREQQARNRIHWSHKSK